MAIVGAGTALMAGAAIIGADIVVTGAGAAYAVIAGAGGA